MRARSAALFLVLELFGCQRVWDVGNQGGLEEAVRAGFRSAALAAPTARCSMFETTRSGSCTLEAEPGDVKKLVAALKLDPVPLPAPSSVEDVHVSSYRASLEDGHAPCATRAGFSFAEISSAWVSKSRDPHMRSATHSTMEYFAVVQKRGSKALCIEMSYAYG